MDLFSTLAESSILSQSQTPRYRMSRCNLSGCIMSDDVQLMISRFPRRKSSIGLYDKHRVCRWLSMKTSCPLTIGCFARISFPGGTSIEIIVCGLNGRRSSCPWCLCSLESLGTRKGTGKSVIILHLSVDPSSHRSRVMPGLGSSERPVKGLPRFAHGNSISA